MQTKSNDTLSVAKAGMKSAIAQRKTTNQGMRSPMVEKTKTHHQHQLKYAPQNINTNSQTSSSNSNPPPNKNHTPKPQSQFYTRKNWRKEQNYLSNPNNHHHNLKV
ncbi:hypothetical protein Dimus_028460 [Dionaea muscipula]